MFSHVPVAPVDPIFGTSLAYEADPHPSKVNLGVGAYRGNDGKPWVLSCVRKAEKIIYESNNNHEYLPIDGSKQLQELSARLVLGEFAEKNSQKIVSVQALSGTGALRVGGEFAKKWLNGRTIFLPIPTWGNHRAVFVNSGLSVAEYRYFDPKTLGLDYNALIDDLKKAHEGSIILLHACAHNPTGVDPTSEQWKGIAGVMKARNLVPFFDIAYQGFATGSLERDRYAVELFANMGFEMLIAQSFAKNFGLYGERVGCFHVVCKAEHSGAVRSQLKLVVRPMYSNPPTFGARVIITVLSDPVLYQEWIENLKTMSGRINQVRTLLYNELVKLKTPGTWNHIINQIGMFTYTGLTEDQCQILISQHHVYLLKSGRISMAGINTSNVGYLAKSIHSVVTSSSSRAKM